MSQRLKISLKPKPALTMRRVALDHERLVYVICADRKLRYPNGYSQIAYIGTTRNGISRVAESAAYRSWDVLWSHGVQSLDVRIVTCRPRQGFKSWVKLERALILAFRQKFGKPPMCNIQGRAMKLGDEFDRFALGRLNRIIETLSEAGARGEREPITDTLDEATEDEEELV
ncbi:hypothetical protein [Sphingopyxis sp.]|uniref:hypothetical protein n=1 Tax=Sphingopyxis sp. TaxID=1908224 RepID=UPI001DED3936|nr:hypothetical protein [Sphingopyxis sp.]MBW8296252.1 hypothetical protein [Sphingopyxis sp.]